MRGAQFTRGVALVMCLTLAAALFACSDTLPTTASADAERPASAVALAPRVQVPIHLVGCASFEVRLSGRNGITVGADERDCGPIRPVLAGEPAFDRTEGRVRLPLALVNSGRHDVTEPAGVYGWEDSLEVMGPRGLGRNKHTYLTLAGADSVIADTAAEYAGARFWRYDAALADEGGDRILASGDTSGVRWIEIAVHDGVHVFEAAFHARAERARPPVPAIAPDTIPGWIYADSNIVASSPCVTGPLIQNVAIVLFEEGTPQPKRQAAVDAIDGTVIGGSRFGGDGEYFVLIEDDGTAGPLCRAMSTLESLPYVEYARSELFIPEAYREPADGPNFRDWRVRPDSANGTNWALEAIAAPLAWACDTGSVAAPVAVAGSGLQGISNVTELTPNLAGVAGPLVGSSGHGITVNSIMAARGNDGDGMTGVMWNAGLRVYSRSRLRNGKVKLSLTDLAQSVYTAGSAGAKVINISGAIWWTETKGRLPYPVSNPGVSADSMAADSGDVHDVYAAIVGRLKQLEGPLPLLVVAAGNDGIDAFWGGLATLGADSAFPKHVLTVAGVTQPFVGHMGLAPKSNRGDLVDIAAPGFGVAALNGAGTLTAVSGTSAAAPFVTGVAGLLLSFDSRLTPAQLHDLILAGARNGGRDAAGIPVLNAYESLKLAALREGAPLCHSRVWAEDGSVFAWRKGGAEELFRTGGTLEFLNARHGGRRVDVLEHDSNDRRTFLYRDTDWVEAGEPWTLPPELPGATYRSVIGLSHDADSTARTILEARTSVGDSFSVVIRDRATRSFEKIASFLVPFEFERTVVDRLCSMKQWVDETTEDGEPSFTGYRCVRRPEVETVVRRSGARTAYSPMGDRVLIAVDKTV